MDRRQREKNIVVTGLPDENEALDGATTDESKLNIIWRKIEANEKIKEHRRLGPKIDNRRRPVLITLNSGQARNRLMARASQLKEVGGEFTRIYKNKDVHPAVRAEWRRLREAEKKKKERPENFGCMIRLDTRERKLYRDGVVIDEWNLQGL